jgi:serine/threonine protein kinase
MPLALLTHPPLLNPDASWFYSTSALLQAGSTTIVNKTYITIKHLGSGTFGRVMLCFNVYDQRLYAIKVCRKSQFASSMSRLHSNSRLRRSMAAGGSYSSLPSPSSSSCFTAGRSCGGGAGGAAMLPGVSGGSMSSPTTAAGNASSCAISCGGALHSTQGVTNICATSGSSSMVGAGAAAAASAAAAAALFGSGSGGGGGARGSFAFPAPGAAWPAASPTIWQLQQPQVLGAGQQLPPQPPSPPSPPSFAADAQQQQQQQLALPVQPRSSASPVFGHMGSRSGPLPPPPHPGALLSSGSQGGGVGVLMGTDCSTGSLSGGSVFQEALMRFQTEELVKEIAILKKLHHPNIVNLVEVRDYWLSWCRADVLALPAEWLFGTPPRVLSG